MSAFLAGGGAHSFEVPVGAELTVTEQDTYDAYSIYDTTVGMTYADDTSIGNTADDTQHSFTGTVLKSGTLTFTNTNMMATVGLKAVDLEPVRESVRLLMASGIDYEFRTTVVDELHSEEDFDRIGQWIQSAKRYYLQAFTDRDTVPFGGLHAPSAEKMKNCLAWVKPWVEAAQLRGVDE